MQIRSSNLYLATEVLNQMAKDHSWVDMQGKAGNSFFTNEQILTLKALKKYTDWNFAELSRQMGYKKTTLESAARRRNPELTNANIPDAFFEMTGMTRGKIRPQGVAKETFSRKLPVEKVALIRELHQRGVTTKNIAVYVGVSRIYTLNIINKDVYPFVEYTKEHLPEDIEVIAEQLRGE